MKILIVSPLVYSINAESKYVGIEKLAWQYAVELSKRHEVAISCHSESTLPPSVLTFPFTPLKDEDHIAAELRAYQNYHRFIRQFDVIHDFSHAHLIARYNANMPVLNLFWHDPVIRYPKAPYNIIAPSNWAARRFRQFYKQESRVQQSIVVDTKVYKPLPKSRRTDRFLTIGRMAPEKGNLHAIELCMRAGVPLDVCGGDSDAAYKDAILKLCDGKQIRFLGEVTEKQKVKLMQTCRGLIYATEHAEVTNHKLQEVMMCQTPVLVSAIGAAPEIVSHGVNGYLCIDDMHFLMGIEKIDTLPVMDVYKAFKARYAIENVVGAYEKLYLEVAQGARW